MKKTYTLLLLLVAATYSFAGSNFTPSKYQCAGIEQRIDNINSKMRAGYSTREGEQLKNQLRTLKNNVMSAKRKGSPLIRL